MLSQIKIIIFVVAVVGVFGLHLHEKEKAVDKARAELIAEHDKQIINSTTKRLEIEAALKEQYKQDLLDKNEKIISINNQLARANGMLAKRPQRPDNVPISTNPALPSTSCTGAELYRQDGEFLIGEAARAERIKEERDFFYKQYANAQQELERLSNNGKTNPE